jgi:hypothetical protein
VDGHSLGLDEMPAFLLDSKPIRFGKASLFRIPMGLVAIPDPCEPCSSINGVIVAKDCDVSRGALEEADVVESITRAILRKHDVG